MLRQSDLPSINTADACAGDDGDDTEEPVADVEGCMDANASNYNADATVQALDQYGNLVCCLLYTSPSPRDRTRSRMPSSA